MLKKLPIFALIMIFIFSSLGSTAFGNEKGDKQSTVVFEQEEIVDLKALKNRAINGVSENVSLPFQAKGAIAKINGDGEKGEEHDLKTHITTQKLKKVKDSENNIETLYATTYFTTAITGSYSKSGIKTDYPADTVEATETIYWTEKFDGLQFSYRLNRTKGGWLKYDSNVSVKDRRVQYGQVGDQDIVEKTEYPTSNSFDYTTPSSWTYILKGSAYSISSNSYITIYDGIGEWELHLMLLE